LKKTNKLLIVQKARGQPTILDSFPRLHLIAQAGAFFVTRAKDNLQFARQFSRPVDMLTGLRSDQIGKPKLPKADFSVQAFTPQQIPQSHADPMWRPYP